MQESGSDGNFPFPYMSLMWKGLKPDDCKGSDYRMEKPSPLRCLALLFVKAEKQ